MFTGIVEEVGIIESLSEIAGGWSLVVKAQTTLGGTRLGDSIAVNGASSPSPRLPPTISQPASRRRLYGAPI